MNSKSAAAAACTVAAISALLAGCNQNRASADPSANVSAPGLCTPFKTANTATGASNGAAGDLSAAFEDCAHRWSYALAPARDPADVVAQAVVDACSSALSSWNQQTLNQNPQGGPPQATSLTTGQPTVLLGARTQYAQARALFYVVQARAGNCPAPPPNTLASVTQPSG